MRLLLALILVLAVLAPTLAEPVADTVLAEQLAEYGTRQKDPEALLLATKLFLKNPSSVFQGQGVEEPDEGYTGTQDSTAPAGPVYQPAQLLKQIRGLTQEPALLSRAGQLEEELSKSGKSPLSGVLRGSETVRGKHRWSTSVEFIGEEQAQVQVLGQETAALQLVVYDEDGEWITGTKGSGPSCQVSWTAARDGLFKIVVRNRGAKPSPFRFVLR